MPAARGADTTFGCAHSEDPLTVLFPAGGRRRRIHLPSAVGPAAVYLVTMATAGRECLFGEVAPDGALKLSEFGWMVQREWLRTGFVRPELELDAYVVMPNHLHAVLAVRPGAAVAAAPLHAAGAPGAAAREAGRVAEPALAPAPVPPHRVLGAALAGFKAMCTVQINHRRGRPGAPVWQRGCVERVLRSAAELDAARRHIEENPARWLARQR